MRVIATSREPLPGCGKGEWVYPGTAARCAGRKERPDGDNRCVTRVRLCREGRAAPQSFSPDAYGALRPREAENVSSLDGIPWRSSLRAARAPRPL